MPKQWFYNWFNSPYYHLLYSRRNREEAEYFVNNLLAKINPAPGSALLDVACGRGRHSVYLNQKGYHVTGFDLSATNIGYAKQFKNDKLHFLVHDMRDPLNIDGFDMAINLFTSFGYFDTDEEHITALKNINRALKHGGILVLDYFNRQKVLKEMLSSYIINIDGISFNIKKIIKGNKIIKDIIFKDGNKVYNFKEKVSTFDMADFNRFFLLSNFEITAKFGNYSLDEFDINTSDRLILICKKTNA